MPEWPALLPFASGWRMAVNFRFCPRRGVVRPPSSARASPGCRPQANAGRLEQDGRHSGRDDDATVACDVGNPEMKPPSHVGLLLPGYPDQDD